VSVSRLWALGLLVSAAAVTARGQGADAGTPAAGSPSDIESALLEQQRTAGVITASGAEESRATAAANVVTIDYEAIESRGYQSVAEILQSVPGLYVVDDGVIPSVSVRGISGGLRAGTRIVKVMINGVQVSFRPDLTAFLGPEFIPVQMIERVEIAKGPLSSLYGANAFLATVNVITRGSQSTSAPLVAELSTRARMVESNFGYGASVVAGYDDNGRSLMLAASADKVDRSGQSIQKTFAAQDPTRSPYRSFLGIPTSGDVAYPLSAFGQYTARSPAWGNLTVQGGLQHLDSSAQFQVSSTLTESRVSLENLWASARYEKAWTDVISTNAWLEVSRGNPTQDEVLYLTGNKATAYLPRYGYQAYDGALEVTAAFGPGFGLKVGGDFSYEHQRVLAFAQRLLDIPTGSALPAGSVVEPTFPCSSPTNCDPYLVDLSDVAAYAQVSAVPLEHLRLTANGRVDLPNVFPLQYSWRFGAAYDWSSTFATKLVAGRAFQTPSAVQLYGQPNFGTTGNVSGATIFANASLSNTPLDPQVVTSLEAVGSLQVGRYTLELSAFGQRVEDRIEFQRAGSDFKAANAGAITAVGAELEAHAVFGPLSLGLSGHALQVLAVDEPAIVIIPDPASVGPPASFPQFKAVGEAGLSFPELHFAFWARARAVGPRGASQANSYLNNSPYTLPGYVEVDARLATLGLNFLGGAQSSLSLVGRNLLDDRHSEPGFGGFDLPSLGRTFILELRQSY
jgi:outer membrane receptor protein involved in Fe transport